MKLLGLSRVRRGGAKTIWISFCRPQANDSREMYVYRLRTNVLPGEERFDKGFDENRISQELLQYLKQQTLMVPPPISEMQRIQNNMDNLLYRTNLGEDQKAKQYMQLQNKSLNYKHQLKSLIPEATIPTQPKSKIKFLRMY